MTDQFDVIVTPAGELDFWWDGAGAIRDAPNRPWSRRVLDQRQTNDAQTLIRPMLEAHTHEAANIFQSCQRQTSLAARHEDS